MFSIVHLPQYVETLKTEKEEWIYKTLVISNRSNYLVKSLLDEQNFTISFRTQIGRHSNLWANSVGRFKYGLFHIRTWEIGKKFWDSDTEALAEGCVFKQYNVAF